MNGLLDPQTLALLTMGGGLLQASGPSRTPVSTGQALGQGLLQGVGAYQQGVMGNQQLAQSQLQMEEVQRKRRESEAQKAQIEAFANSLPPDQKQAFMVSPQDFLKAQFKQKFPAPGNQFAPSSLGKLIAERNTLPPDSPLRAAYDNAIKNVSEGQERSPSYQFFPTPTGVVSLDRRSGKAGDVTLPGGAPIVSPAASPTLQGQLAKAKAVGKESGEAQTQAQIDLPRVIDNANNSLNLIDQMVGSEDGKVKKHPGFNTSVGAGLGPITRRIPGTDAAGFHALLDQVKGGAFLEAFNSLKGGGQITEVEGKKATDAITRMQTATKESEFIKAAREYQNIIRLGVQRAQRKAGYAGPERRGVPAGVPPELWNVMTPEERSAWSQ